MLSDLKLPPITFRKATYYTLGRSEPVRAFVNHRMVGTLIGTDSYFTNPTLTKKVSTHFGIGYRSGKVAISQYVPLDDTAYGNGNYDPSGNWDNWGFKTTEINAQTISIEHEDHDGTTANKGIVKEEIQQASMALQALIRWGTLDQWKAAGIVVRNWTTNGPILQREIRAIPIDGRHVIMHYDIAGALKPYCWRPWMADKVGFPRDKYVTGIATTYRDLLAYVAPPPTYTQAQLDAAVKAATDPLNLQLTTQQTAFDTLATAYNRERAKAIEAATDLLRVADRIKVEG